MDQTQTYLAHHGVKGQKWGVRRTPAQLGHLLTKKKRKTKTPAEKTRLEKEKRRIKAKNRRTLSDAELKKRVERLELEKKYKDLSDKDTNPGRKAVASIMSDSGKKVATAFAAGAMAYTIKMALEGEGFNAKEFAKYVAPNPNQKK